MTHISTILLILALSLCLAGAVQARSDDKPRLVQNPSKSAFSVEYRGRSVFSATVRNGGGAKISAENVSQPVKPIHLGYGHGPVDAGGIPEGMQAESLMITISTEKPEQSILIDGSVNGGPDSFACIPDGGPQIVRGAVGQSHSLLNRGVFDREGDWAIWAAEPAKCMVEPVSGKLGQFRIEASGTEVKIIVAIDFYRAHRGFVYWDPNRKKLWEKPVAGWCSWSAYGTNVTESQFLSAADLFSRELREYGYDVIQLDEGYENIEWGAPRTMKPGEKLADMWLHPKPTFPHGMKWLAAQIRDRKLTPGVWLGVVPLPLGLPDDWYVKGPDGKPYNGEWVQYSINGLIPEAEDGVYLQAIRGLKRYGWDYFKIDGLRHVIYDGYRKVPDYWRARNENPDEAWRALLSGIKDAIGLDVYTLACWGVIPEAAGIADGCRIGEDVEPKLECLLRTAYRTCQFNYLNNIIWRNDPDYMCFRVPVEQARTWASFVALTGMQTMVSDPSETYDEARLDILRKVGPPMFVRPVTLSSVKPDAELWTLEASGSGDSWLVAARIAWDKSGLPARDISFAELGLDPTKRHLAFDFWNEKYLGEFQGKLPAESLPQGECRVYCVREALGRPQVIGTNRHIGNGICELKDVAWRGNKLTGKMRLPAGRPFSLFVHAPKGYELTDSLPTSAVQSGETIKLTLSSKSGGWVAWDLKFAGK